MNREKLTEKYKQYNLTSDDVFKHAHYMIITRSGMDKIQAIEQIAITYDVIRCEPNFAGMKATATKGDKQIQTFGSAIKGSSFKDGNTNSYYVLEMAEKRAMSRAILKISGMYELGAMSQDESEDFKRPTN